MKIVLNSATVSPEEKLFLLDLPFWKFSFLSNLAKGTLFPTRHAKFDFSFQFCTDCMAVSLTSVCNARAWFSFE